MAAVEFLQKSCAKNGLPTDGSKADLLKRLLQKRAGEKDDDDELYKTFAEAERQNLVSSGMADEDIEEEIARRWSVMKNLKSSPDKAKGKAAKAEPKAKAEPNPNVKVFPMLLDAQQLAALDYIYIGPTKSGEHMYGLKQPQPPTPMPTPDPSDSKKKGKSTDKSAAESGKKRKQPAPAPVVKPEPVEEEDDPDMNWACEISQARLLKKVKKEHMIPLLQDFGVPCKGSKEELALALAEQLHYETDEEDAE